MARFSEYLGGFLAVVAATVFVLWANFFGNSQPVDTTTVIVPELSVASSSAQAPNTLSGEPTVSAPTTTGQKTQVVTAQKPAPAPGVATKPAVATESLATTSPLLSAVTAPDTSFDTASASLRSALVNIICYAPAGSGLHSISGSGVFIDSKGIILTNAHVAQYFLLGDRNISCEIRTGSPAVTKYKAALAYISPLWIRANATVLTQAQPTGNGQYDFAVLAVTKSATSNPLPTSFPYVPLAQNPPLTGTPVVIASYGAQFLQASQVENELNPTVVFGSIKQVFTYAVNSIDAFSLGGSAAAQEGSSGGGVADAQGNLVGTITTSTVSGDTASRVLDAITASYIRAEYASEMGSPIDFMLSEPTSVAVAEFASRIPTLEAIITADLPQ